MGKFLIEYYLYEHQYNYYSIITVVFKEIAVIFYSTYFPLFLLNTLINNIQSVLAIWWVRFFYVENCKYLNYYCERAPPIKAILKIKLIGGNNIERIMDRRSFY